MSKIKTYLKQSFTLFVCGALSFTANAQQEAISAFTNTKEFKHASISLCVKDLNTGKELASLNPNQSLTPASILKVVTTASAFEILGADYKFKTTLAADNDAPNRLIVHGYGDPTLGSEYIGQSSNLFLTTWINNIKKSKTSTPFDIFIVDDYFGYNGQSRKWIKEDMGNYYAAGAYGISIHDNTYRLFFNTTGGQADITKTEPPMEDITFDNNLNLNNRNKDNGYILGEAFSNNRRIIGDIPANKSSFSIKGDIPDPGTFLGKELSSSLEKAGVKVNSYKSIRTNPHDYNETVFYTHLSPPLKDIAKVINVRSNNHYAEHLIRAVGRSNASSSSDALSDGIQNIDGFWKSKGLDTEGLFMYDGCGLSPSNAVNASFMCDVLTQMKNNSDFLNTFPKAGQEGTVRNFLKGSKLEGKVRVKSGSIAKVQCFAGYYIDGNKKYAFTVMVNNFNGSHRDAVKAIEKLLLNIF